MKIELATEEDEKSTDSEVSKFVEEVLSNALASINMEETEKKIKENERTQEYVKKVVSEIAITVAGRSEMLQEIRGIADRQRKTNSPHSQHYQPDPSQGQSEEVSEIQRQQDGKGSDQNHCEKKNEEAPVKARDSHLNKGLELSRFGVTSPVSDSNITTSIDEKRSRARVPSAKIRDSQTFRNENKEESISKDDKIAKTKPKLYCICRKEWEDGKFYIGCDFCDDWLHGKCVGIPKNASGIELFRCPACRDRNNNTPLTQLLPKAYDTNSLSEIQEKTTTIEALNNTISKITSESGKLKDSLTEAEERCKKWKENSKNLQIELNKKQKLLDNHPTEILKLKTEITKSEKSHAAKVEELKLSQEKIEALNKNLTASNNTAEILSKKCTKLEKSNTLQTMEIKELNDKVEKKNDTIKEHTGQIESLQKEKKGLELEVATVKKISDKFMQQPPTKEDVGNGKTSKPKDVKQDLKKAEKEIASLKDLIKNLELVTRDLQIEKQTLQDQCDAQKHNLAREKHINNILMSFNVNNSSPPTPTNTANALSPPPLGTYQMLPQTIDRSYASAAAKGAEGADSNLSPNMNHPDINKIKQMEMDNTPKTHDQPPSRSSNSTHSSYERTSHQNSNEVHNFCSYEFQGYGQCSHGDNCNDNHNIDFKRLKRGICFNEFFKKGSCRNGINCAYCHTLPESIRSDPAIMNSIDEKIKKSREKKGEDSRARNPPLHQQRWVKPAENGGNMNSESHTPQTRRRQPQSKADNAPIGIELTQRHCHNQLGYQQPIADSLTYCNSDQIKQQARSERNLNNEIHATNNHCTEQRKLPHQIPFNEVYHRPIELQSQPFQSQNIPNTTPCFLGQNAQTLMIPWDQQMHFQQQRSM